MHTHFLKQKKQTRHQETYREKKTQSSIQNTRQQKQNTKIHSLEITSNRNE